ncbi:MAG: hypothetical protein P1V97_39405 [Planctomycetota bacterium]|nr:hypothetical protein [Planctomycetota bacterium]
MNEESTADRSVPLPVPEHSEENKGLIDQIDEESVASEDAAPTSSRFKQALGHLGKILVYGAVHIPVRMLGWGVGGFFSGVAGFFFPYVFTDCLVIPEPDYQALVWILLPVYMIAGAILMGMAGFARGIGRVVIYAVIEQGLAKFIMDKILNKTIEFARKSEKVSGAMDSGEFMLENIPLGKAEDYLKRSVRNFLDGDDLENAAGEVSGFKAKVLRWIKKYIASIIEKYLLAVVRAETDPGGICMKKVVDLGLEFAEEKIEDFIVGLMNKKTMLMAAATLLVYALAPISFAIWTYQVSS